MTTHRRPTWPELFASGALALAAVGLVAVLAFAFRDADTAAGTGLGDDSDGGASADGGSPVDLDDGAVADPDADPAAVVADAADAMAAVTSVQFGLERDGAPVFIDQFESIALDELIGQFSVPSRARAELTVTVDGNLSTKLGAVALDEEVWISNPVTGDFETLPDGYDIDPSRFFDPSGGWQPLLDGLFDVELIGVDDRGGDRYHIGATAPADEVRNITVGLVEGQDVPVELWIHPGTSLVTRAAFTTTIDGRESRWVLDLDRYGEQFTIRPPANVRS
jgi:lipoprotein LprG